MAQDNYDTAYLQQGAGAAFKIAADDARKLRKALAEVTEQRDQARDKQPEVKDELVDVADDALGYIVRSAEPDDPELAALRIYCIRELRKALAEPYGYMGYRRRLRLIFDQLYQDEDIDENDNAVLFYNPDKDWEADHITEIGRIVRPLYEELIERDKEIAARI